MATILIIDDLPELQDFLSRILSTMGHDVLVASDGKQGCELAKSREVAAILTDLSMPGELSELELVRQLRELRPDCPIIVCSGYPSEDRIEECEQLGITDFLTKPFELPYVQSVINRVLDEGGNQTQ